MDYGTKIPPNSIHMAINELDRTGRKSLGEKTEHKNMADTTLDGTAPGST